MTSKLIEEIANKKYKLTFEDKTVHNTNLSFTEKWTFRVKFSTDKWVTPNVSNILHVQILGFVHAKKCNFKHRNYFFIANNISFSVLFEIFEVLRYEMKLNIAQKRRSDSNSACSIW